MDGEALQEAARKCAQNLPGTDLYTFEEGWQAARVRTKWFMLMTTVPQHPRARDARAVAGQPVVIVKADPDDAVGLREAHVEITPGYHMNKKHWITLGPGDAITDELVDELVTDSYRLVLETLPRSQRPTDLDAG
ncbi:MmcQ/YjbR family DNA-binding protein [Saccharopolyspora mangrovi]|uniref:MmcQ/YjbR family DNA-binding protein n=1 Tax=Saccharopolyspora mangrovi TaxID=3082379 RepID=A0ABU6A497_9PSEU|nr:MmcQ/YjbR family DNA-binding protein [Saccharopolyspora sp. S2-29]MEB3366382.1 MmcQ/YjbR family DNA-binding protein [Saccharopolyspora sp. S2-29]